MEGLTVAEIAAMLKIQPCTAKKRLQTQAIKPIGYAGPTALYSEDVIEMIRDVPGPGRPKK